MFLTSFLDRVVGRFSLPFVSAYQLPSCMKTSTTIQIPKNKRAKGNKAKPISLTSFLYMET